MSAGKITSSERKLSAWKEVRALDRLAVPLLESLGVRDAYLRALYVMEHTRKVDEGA